MKEDKLIKLLKSVTELEKTIELVIRELANVRHFSVSTHEVIKRMKGYDVAVSKLKKDIEKEKKERAEAEQEKEKPTDNE